MKEIKNQSLIANKEGLVYNLPSIIFNNSWLQRVVSRFSIIMGVLAFGYIYYKPFSLAFYVAILLFLFVVVFVVSPRKLRLNHKHIQYHNFWREKWSDIVSYKFIGTNLIIYTIGGKERIIKNIPNEFLEDISSFISNEIKPN
jgi:hypothetical protein